MAAAPADMFCEPLAFHLPALTGPYPTGIPIQMDAQEHKSVQCWRNLMGDWPAVKLQRQGRAFTLFCFSFI